MFGGRAAGRDPLGQMRCRFSVSLLLAFFHPSFSFTGIPGFPSLSSPIPCDISPFFTQSCRHQVKPESSRRSHLRIDCRSGASSGAKTDTSGLEISFPRAPREELARFLLKQNGDVEKASRMYNNYVEWSKKSLPIIEQESACVPEWLWFHGHARDGTRILFVQGAMHDPSRATAEQFTLHTAKKMLELGAESDSKVTVLVDVRAQDGLANPPATKLLPYLRQVAPLMNNFFPGRLKLVKGFLSSSTASKVMLLSGSDRAGSPVPEQLREFVDFEELRPDVQGTHTSLVQRRA